MQDWIITTFTHWIGSQLCEILEHKLKRTKTLFRSSTLNAIWIKLAMLISWTWTCQNYLTRFRGQNEGHGTHMLKLYHFQNQFHSLCWVLSGNFSKTTLDKQQCWNTDTGDFCYFILLQLIQLEIFLFNIQYRFFF